MCLAKHHAVIYILIDVQTNSITAEFWRKPWTDTIAYWKLDWDLNDYSWNNRHATWSSNITYQTLTSWIKVAKTTSNSNDWISVPWNIANLLSWDFTVSFWINPAWAWTMWLMFAIRRDVSPYTWVLIWYWFSDNYIRFNLNDNEYIRTSVTRSQIQWKRTHICLTRKNWVVKCYINANQEWSMNSSSFTTNWDSWYIVSRINAQNMYSWTMWSEFIVEKKWRTDEEIIKYVNNTKNKYWL